jgi:TolB-like protein
MKKKIEVRKQKDGSREEKGIKEVKKGGKKSQKLRIQARIFKIRSGRVVWTDRWTYMHTDGMNVHM